MKEREVNFVKAEIMKQREGKIDLEGKIEREEEQLNNDKEELEDLIENT